MALETDPTPDSHILMSSNTASIIHFHRPEVARGSTSELARRYCGPPRILGDRALTVVSLDVQGLHTAKNWRSGFPVGPKMVEYYKLNRMVASRVGCDAIRGRRLITTDWASETGIGAFYAANRAVWDVSVGRDNFL